MKWMCGAILVGRRVDNWSSKWGLSLPSCLVISLFVACHVGIGHAAEVGCNTYWKEEHLDRIAPDRAQTWWLGQRPTTSSCRIGFISGEITKGDYDKVVAFYRMHHPFLVTFMLHSPGGSVDEAIKIGRLFRKYSLTAMAPFQLGDKWFLGDGVPAASQLPRGFELVPSGDCAGIDCICVSACAFMWFGAPARSGKVGLHRPYTKEPAFKELDRSEAAKAYGQVLNWVIDYLKEMEVAEPIIQAMISTGSSGVKWVEDESGNRPASFVEWVDASCGHFSDQEYLTMLTLGAKDSANRIFESGPKLTSSEKLLLDTLQEKWFGKNRCESQLMASSRSKLPTP